MNTIKEFKTIKARVKHIMETELRARNSDKWLTFRVFEDIAKENGEKIYFPFHLFPKFPAFETIKRMRAEIQNVDGELLPTDESVINRRRIRAKDIKEFYGEGL